MFWIITAIDLFLILASIHIDVGIIGFFYACFKEVQDESPGS